MASVDCWDRRGGADRGTGTSMPIHIAVGRRVRASTIKVAAGRGCEQKIGSDAGVVSKLSNVQAAIREEVTTGAVPEDHYACYRRIGGHKEDPWKSLRVVREDGEGSIRSRYRVGS